MYKEWSQSDAAASDHFDADGGHGEGGQTNV
jgi:hypothetical protein